MELEILCRSKKTFMQFEATGMELEAIMPSELNQKERDRHGIISPIWGLRTQIKVATR